MFFPSLSHKKGVHRIVRGLESNCGLILLTGEIGIGKTSLARHIQSYLADSFVFVEMGNPYQTPLEQIFYCCEKFGLDTSGISSIHDCVGRLERYFYIVHAQGKRPVIVFDESHLLTKRHLSLIHILSNLRADDGPLVQILLVGQLEILDLLNTEGMEALNQRIGVRCELSPLVLEDTDKYISFKLEKAGGGREMVTFSREAVEKIWKKSSGLPRLINHVCAHTLDALAFRDTRVVTSEMVDEVCRDAVYTGMFQAKTEKADSGRRVWIFGGAAAAIVASLLGAWFLWPIGREPVCEAPASAEVKLGVMPPAPAPAPMREPAPIPAAQASAPIQDPALVPSARVQALATPASAAVDQAPVAASQAPAQTVPHPADAAPAPASIPAKPDEVVVVIEDPGGESANGPPTVRGLDAESSETGGINQGGVPGMEAEGKAEEPEAALLPEDQIKDGNLNPVLSKLVLGAIAWNENPKASIAIIDSNLYHEGERVDGIKLIHIGQDYLLVQYSGEYYRLEFPR
ncbi:MAG: AAA family ATPase [Pseudodesulfovibrio sp.]